MREIIVNDDMDGTLSILCDDSEDLSSHSKISYFDEKIIIFI